MPIGKMNQRIAIEYIVSTAPDDSGQDVHQWGTLAEVWAEVVDARPSERTQGMQTSGQMSRIFKIRFRADVTARMRILYDGNYYDLAGPPVGTGLGRRQFTELVGVYREGAAIE